MASITYTFSLRDNIDNQDVTGSAILPYYPPTGAPLSSSYKDNVYEIVEDVDKFVGWSVNRSSNRAYKLPDGQTVNIKRSTTLGYYLEVNIPVGLKNPTNPSQNGPYTWTTEEFAEIPSTTIIIDYINSEESRVDSGTVWTKFKEVDLQPATSVQVPPTNGFRIKTPGYQDLSFFAESLSGLPLIPNLEGILDLGIYKLIRIEADSQKEASDLQKVDSTTILTNAPSSEKAKGVNKLSQILQSRTTVIKNVLVTALVAQITQFGISKIKDIIEKKVSLDKLPKVCPTPAKLAQLIAIRNKYTDQLNKFYTDISRLSTALTGTNKVAQVISTALTIAGATRQAANIALSFIPVTPGAAPSAINILKDLEDTIKPRIEKVLKTVGILTSTIAFITAVLLIVIELLKLLDNLILLCAEEQGVPYEAISAQLTALNPGLTNALQNSTPTINNSYKGFKFELMLDTTNNTKYPKRYAVAVDKFGVILLKSESSFTPNPEVLINELKFIIDRDNLSAE